MSSTLTFLQLRSANISRDHAVWKECDTWSATDWGCAVAGEVGEACDLLKKRRGGASIPPVEIGRELADAVIYIDLLALHLGIDLGKAVRDKFNEVSAREGSDVIL